MAWPPSTHQDVQDAVTALQGGMSTPWAGLVGPPTSGYMRAPLNESNQSGAFAPAEGTAYAVPFTLFATTTITKLAAGLWSNGTTGAVVRLGLYASDASGYPSSLISDGGTFNATTGSTALVSVTLSPSVPLSPGGYFAVAVVQGSAATRPLLLGTNSDVFNVWVSGLAAQSPYYGRSSASAITGALPGTFPVGASALSGNNTQPFVFIGA